MEETVTVFGTPLSTRPSKVARKVDVWEDMTDAEWIKHLEVQIEVVNYRIKMEHDRIGRAQKWLDNMKREQAANEYIVREYPKNIEDDKRMLEAIRAKIAELEAKKEQP